MKQTYYNTLLLQHVLLSEQTDKAKLTSLQQTFRNNHALLPLLS